MKKFLSMVMALAMTLTLVTVGASAKDFTDKSTITYGEAVDVISGIGVVDGYTDGSFNPTATLTRGAAAKIICNMILGPTVASALGATSAPFADVPTSNVFAGYIAYCAKEGIINGYTDGSFKPAATVTGYQFLKMLLGALGYDGSIEGFTGSNWSVNVAKLALSIGLTDGNDGFVGSKAMTREEAALYAFNTLSATEVKYTGGTTMTVNGVTFTSGATIADVPNSATSYYGSADGKMQFCEDHFTKLTLNTATATNGLPGTVWKLNGTTAISDVKATADLIGASSNGTSITNLTTVVTNSKYIAALNTPTYYYNGYEVKTSGAVTTSDYVLDSNAIKPVTTAGTMGSTAVYGSAIVDLTAPGKGVSIALFDTDDDTDTAEAVAVTTYTVEKLSAAPVVKNNSVDGKDYVYINMVGANDIGVPAVYGVAGAVKASDVSGYAGLAKNDIVCVYQFADGTYNIVKAGTFQGTATAVTGTGLSTLLTIDGTKYGYSASADASITGFSSYKVSYSWYTDANGYLVYGEATGDDSTTYAVVLDAAYTAGSLSADSTMKAQILLTDGTVKVVDVSYVNGEKVDLTTGKTTTLTGGVQTYLDTTKVNSFFKYSIASDGTYKLTYGGSDATTWSASGVAGTTEYSAGTVSMNGATINTATNVILATTVAGETKYTVYTGYSSVPSINISDSQSVVFSKHTNTSGAVDYVYVDLTANATSGDASADYVYILDPVYTTDQSTDTTMYYFTAIYNGEVTSIATSSLSIAGILDNGQGLYGVKVDNDGVITAVAQSDGTTFSADGYTSGAEVAPSSVAAVAADGVFSGYAYDGTETVWVIDLANKTAVESTIDDITTDDYVTVLCYTSGTAAHQQTIQYIFAEY